MRKNSMIYSQSSCPWLRNVKLYNSYGLWHSSVCVHMYRAVGWVRAIGRGQTLGSLQNFSLLAWFWRKRFYCFNRDLTWQQFNPIALGVPKTPFSLRHIWVQKGCHVPQLFVKLAKILMFWAKKGRILSLSKQFLSDFRLLLACIK